jgi:hypothetical protein
MLNLSVTPRRCAVVLIVAIVLLAITPQTSAAFTATKFAGTYTLQNGKTGAITLDVIRMSTGAWEGLAKIDGKNYYSSATTGDAWAITIFSLDGRYRQKIVATLRCSLSEDGTSLTGFFTLKGSGGQATLGAVKETPPPLPS